EDRLGYHVGEMLDEFGVKHLSPTLYYVLGRSDHLVGGVATAPLPVTTPLLDRLFGLKLRGPPNKLAIQDFRSGVTEGRSWGNPVGWLYKSLGQETIANQSADRVGGGVMSVGKTVILNGLQEILPDYDSKECGIAGNRAGHLNQL